MESHRPAWPAGIDDTTSRGRLHLVIAMRDDRPREVEGALGKGRTLKVGN